MVVGSAHWYVILKAGGGGESRFMRGVNRIKNYADAHDFISSKASKSS